LEEFSYLKGHPTLLPTQMAKVHFDGVLNIPMPEIILNQPRICALVGQGEAARLGHAQPVPEHQQE
jgi:hypothetical protein